MLTAYLDESGHESGKFVVIAGFLGTDAQWSALEAEWQESLGQSSSFHIKDLRWNKDSTRRRLEKLGAIPHKHGLQALIGAVNVSDYAHLAANLPEAYAIQGYYIALHPILAAVKLTVPSSQTINWVLEEQHDYEAQARRIFRVYAEDFGPNRFSNVSFASKAASCLGQSADYLAYAVLQELRDAASTRAQWCRPIRGDGTFLGKITEAKEMRAIADTALRQAAALTALQTGVNPRMRPHNYAGKRGVAEALQRAEDARKKRKEEMR
jgi:hypothetical protein